MASPFPGNAGEGGRRFPVPSRRLMGAVIFLGAPAALVSLLPHFAVVTWAGALFLGFLLALDFALRPPRGVIRVRRSLRALYHLGRLSSWELRVENLSRRPWAVSLREALPAALEGEELRVSTVLRPRETRAWEIRFVGLERGKHVLDPVGLRVARPLGLLEYQEDVRLADAVAVGPGRPRHETEWLLSRVALLEEAGETTIRRRGNEREFESLREYVAGDEIRRIDWKASARRGRPQVRQYQIERSAQVVLALDCGRLMGSLIRGVAKLDLAMTPVLDLAAVALARGERVGFYAFDSRPRLFVPPRSRLQQLSAISTALATLPVPADPTSYLRAVRFLESRHRKRSLVLVFTDFTDELTAEEMFASLSSLRRRHVLVFVGVGDPHLRHVFDTERDDPRSLFQKAVAGQLLLERRRTLARIERLGISTLDAEPAELSGPLIRRYLEVRMRSVL